MQLVQKLLLGCTIIAAICGGATAQSLSPMRAEGTTPTDIKGFRVTVGNPYPHRMTFLLMPMEPGFVDAANAAEVTPALITLAPGYARQVIFAFRIAPGSRERTVALCIVPKEITGPVLPRVCGTYSGRLLRGAGS